LYDPIAHKLYDKEKHLPETPYTKILMKCEIDVYTGIIRGGEGIYFPEGWIHRVWTTKTSWGYGGQSLSRNGVSQAVDSWLNEKLFRMWDGTYIQQILSKAKAKFPDDPIYNDLLLKIDQWETETKKLEDNCQAFVLGEAERVKAEQEEQEQEQGQQTGKGKGLHLVQTGIVSLVKVVISGFIFSAIYRGIKRA